MTQILQWTPAGWPWPKVGGRPTFAAQERARSNNPLCELAARGCSSAIVGLAAAPCGNFRIPGNFCHSLPLKSLLT